MASNRINDILGLIDGLQNQNRTDTNLSNQTRTDIGLPNQSEIDKKQTSIAQLINSRSSTTSPQLNEPKGAKDTQNLDAEPNIDQEKKSDESSLQPTITIQKSAKNTERHNYKAITYKDLDRDKMTDKFKKMAAVTKAAATTKVSADTYDDCPTTYKQAMASKDKPKWLAAMRDELNLQEKQGTWILVNKPTKRQVLQGR